MEIMKKMKNKKQKEGRNEKNQGQGKKNSNPKLLYHVNENRKRMYEKKKAVFYICPCSIHSTYIGEAFTI
jgi:hypothetical protein